MVLFPWESESSVPVQLNGTNLAAWLDYERLREHFWEKHLDMEHSARSRLHELLETRYKQYEQRFGGYLFKDRHGSIEEARVIIARMQAYGARV
jgi:hypothetical protein